MKRSIILFTALAGLISACQNKTAEQTADSLATSPDTVNKDSKACYVYIKNRDTVSLSYTLAGNAIAGQLSYNLFEKDKNSGTIAGVIKGDTILADYTALGEGTTSVRQVAFLKKGDQLLEGYGDSEDKGGKTVFKDLHALKFGGSIDLSATDCK